MCYRLIVVLLLGLAGLLCYSDCVQAEDVTFDPDHVGVCYQVRSKSVYKFYWGTVQRQNANTYSCRTIWNWPTTCTKYWTTYTKVLIPVASTIYYRYVFCCPGYKDGGDIGDGGSTPGSALCVPECDPECRNGGNCTSPDTCSCPPGWTGPTCSQSTRVCSVNNGGCSQGCVDGDDGAAMCVCDEGYRLTADKMTCTDVDECSVNNGGCGHICVNQNGTHRCECEPGYILNADFKSCIDIDECGINNGECERTCLNSIGSFECTCPQGFLLDENGRTCSDHDECLTGGHDCSQRCINFKSGFLCACFDGYEITDDNSTCIDVDECTDGLSGCSQVCTNTEGSFECSCMVGFTLRPDNKTCEDDDECVGNNGGCDDICVNSVGSFSCDCREGFSLASDATSCTANPCVQLDRPANGNIACTGEQVTDESCSYTCDTGYYLQGSEVQTCLPNGTWSGSKALCIPLECDELIPPDNAVIILPCRQTFLASCAIQCIEGYFIPAGSPLSQECELTVNGTVEWSPPPICLPITACNPNPCLHGGRCIIISPVLSLCDCEGTGYTGVQCQFGIIGAPPFPLLRAGDQPSILNYTAKPDDELRITLVQDNLTAVTFSPSPGVIRNPNISTSIAVTPLISGLYRIAYILSGPNAFDFDIPQDSYLAITPEIASPSYLYFIDRGVRLGQLIPSCCTPASPIYTSCPNGGNVSALSSCFFTENTGAIITEGIMFSTGNGLNLPLAIAGGRLRFLGDDILVDQLASSERSETLDCSLCESLAGNVGNVSDLPPEQCDGFAPAISDIKDFLSTEALAFTYFIESRSLIPSWLSLVPVEDPSRGFRLNAYQVDLQREAMVTNIETCSNIPGITTGLHSLLHYSSLLDVTIANLFSATFTPPESNTPLCFAVNLCQGVNSAFHIGLPQSARQFLRNHLTLFGVNFDIAGISMTTSEPLQIFPTNLPVFNEQYWNGRNRFTPTPVDLDIAFTGTLTLPYQMEDLLINLDFSGILAFGVDNFTELISMGLQQRWHGVFSGGYTLDINFPICGSIANVSLIPTSTFGVVSFGGAPVTSVCSDDSSVPAGISFKVRSVPQQGEKNFLTQLLDLPSDDLCDLDAFLYLTENLDLNGFSMNFQCVGIRLGTFVFHKLEHTIYISGTGDFEDLCTSNPTFSAPASSVLVQSRFINDEPIQLGPILLLQPSTGLLAFTAIFSKDNNSFTAQLHSVNITLFDTIVNTAVNINEDQLYFTANNVPLFTVFPVDYVGSVQQDKTVGEFPLQLMGTFVRAGASFPAILQQTVHDYLTTVANSSITRLRNAEGAIERATDQVRNIEALLQVRQEDFQTANALHEQAIINVALANDSVIAALATVEAASEEVRQLKESIDSICQLQDCPEECIPGLQCNTCYTDVYSTVLGRCPNICYDQKQVRVPPFSEVSTCWVRKQVQVEVRRCVCYRYYCTYQVYFTFVLRTVPEECHRPVFNYEIREEPRLCEKPCPVRILTGRIAQQCCGQSNCSDRVPSSTCLKENAGCRVARQEALDTLTSAKQNFSALFRELEEARMRLVIAVSEEIRTRLRVDVTKEAVNRTQSVLNSTREALQLTITRREELFNMIQDGIMLYQLLQNTSVENIFLIDSVSFEITIVDNTPFTLPLKIHFTIPGISESFEATVVFDFSNINLHLQRTAEVIARMAFGNVDIEDRTKRSRRQTVVMEDPDSTTALVNQRCTDLLNVHDYIEELQDTLETIVEQILSSKMNATEAKLENDALATINEEAFAMVNYSVLQTEFSLITQPNSLLDSLNEGNESKAITAMISSFGEMDEDLANANENSVFLDWQATIEMLHNQTGSSGGYSCFGFADCLTTVVTITRELLQLSPIPESRQLLSQLPAAADDLLQLALSTNLSIFNALEKTTRFRSILNATREMNYWCAQPPNITQHPASDIHLGENSTLRLTCQATSEFGIEYQWRFNGIFIPAAVDAVLIIDNVQQRHSGNYSCDARNHAGISQSSQSSVLVRSLPSIFLQPSDAASYTGNGNGVVFACNASGVPTPGYRWYFKPTGSDNMSIIDGAESNEYTVFSPQAINGGKYYCEAYNEQGSAFSRGAVLTVLHISVSQIAIRVSLGINTTKNNEVIDNNGISNALQNSVEFGAVDIQQLILQETDQNQIITVSFLLVTRNTTSNDTGVVSLEELATRTVETRTDLLSAEDQLQMLADNGTQITSGIVVSSVELGQLEYVCPEGQALDTTNDLLCVNCPPGSFQNAGERVVLVDGVNVTESLPICTACGTNQVQPEQGHTSCISCSASDPNSQKCLVECSPGTFSSTGYQPCSSCPMGTYQPNNGGTECLECDSGSPEAYCTAISEESLFVMGLTPIAISVSAFIIFIIVMIIIVIYCIKRRRKRRVYRMQKKLVQPSATSKFSLIKVNRINSGKTVIQNSDVYVCMPQNEGLSPTNNTTLTDSTTPMFERFILPDTPPPPPPRSNPPSRSGSLNLPVKSPPAKPKPPPIPPRPHEIEEEGAYVIPNSSPNSPMEQDKPPLPPKPVTPNGLKSPSVRPQKPPMPLPRTKPSMSSQQKTQAKPAVMPRIVRRLSQRYRQHSRLPTESYETFLTDNES